ncbi:Uncharacterized protein PCOAH_00000410 [Plasmodium coatneyi]|uniref:PPM-type phosphatase domain-containing protein n=1 Tax=Plasmodium coatneyi TaxID=208452 RepID=A0A1B1DST7_9APIC|nr:Uncharacterized protein PCOAH_00000410 [Plasmodium coatneyi]ANQ05804.1 Uncharacterized protein PCOAH_00000410 [Plasmodium coatneyi]
MQKLLSKCLSGNNSDNETIGEEGLLKTCKIVIGLGNNLDEVNCMNIEQVDNDFLCGFEHYAKKNSTEAIRMSRLNGSTQTYISNLNEYCENHFNEMFNIEYVDFSLSFYEVIFLNFFSSFNQKEGRKKKEKTLWEDNIYVMNRFYQKMKTQKYVLLHKANSIPHKKKKKKNVNYKNGDAFLCSDNMIAIADGVSSIKNSGINVGNFSNELLKKCLNLYLHRCVNSALFEEQNRVVFDQYSIKHKEEEVLKPIVCRSACSSNFLGASTLLLSSVENEKLHICTIGDCQMLILRFRKNCLPDKRIRAVQSNMGDNQLLGNSSKRESAFEDTLQDGTYADMCNDPPDEETIGDPLDATEQGFKSKRYNLRRGPPLSTPHVGNSKNVAPDHSAKGGKFKLKGLYAQRKELYKKDLFREGRGGKTEPHDCKFVTLYMEEVLTGNTCEQFEAYLAYKNYKIGNLTFVVKEEEDCPPGATLSDTITGNSNTKTAGLPGEKYSHTTESDWYENENQPLSTMSTMDESGYRNLLRFFDIDRTDISALDRGEDYPMCVEERPTEGNNHLEMETAMNRSWSEENSQKGAPINHFNNYRFRCYDAHKKHFDIIYKSKVQQHYFNCPFQITFMPSTLGGRVERKASNGGTYANKLDQGSRVKMSTYNDIISKCIRYCEYATADIKNNDIIVSGSDGLFDNLYDDDIMEILFNNFYTVKSNEFVQLKEVYNFYDECNSVLRKVKDIISGDWHKGENPERTFSAAINQSSDVDVNTDHGEELKGEDKPNAVDGESPGTHRSEGNNKGKMTMKGRVNKSEIIPDGKQSAADGEMDGRGGNTDLLSGKINSFDYTRGRRNKTNASENNLDEQRKKEKERSYFFSKKYKSNISTAMLRLKFPSKIKSMFSMRSKGGKSEIGESDRGKDLTKADKNRNKEQHRETGPKRNLHEVKKGANNLLVQKKEIDYEGNSSYSGHSLGSLNRKNLNVGASLKNDDHLGSPSASDAYSDDLKLDNEGNSKVVCNSNAERKAHGLKGVDNLANRRGDNCGFTNGQTDCPGNARTNVLQRGARQRTTEIIANDRVSPLRREKTNDTDKWITEQNTLPGNSEHDSYRTSGITSGGEKKKKKNYCARQNKLNNIYLNTKKACDEIVQLSSILANQELNKTLLRKRRKKYNAQHGNMSSKGKESGPDNAHMCDALVKNKNDKHPSSDAPPTMYEKETHLFDKVNYDDIQSNKSSDKIILTPISEFIFDKYKKYFNMGKPDDITVVLSVVKENKYI